MGVRKQIKRAVKAARKPAQTVAKAAARAAVSELRRQAAPALKQGRAIGRQLLRGHGDYTVNRTIGSSSSGTPTFGATHLTVKRRELLGSVVSSPTAGQFQLTKYVVNPGDGNTFPWLSGIANNFESWKPSGVVFEYLTLSGTAVGSTNTALGQVIMAPQYNAYATDPTTKVQLEGYPDAVSVCVDQSALCGMECQRSNRQADALLVRNSNVAPVLGSMAAALFDLGDFYIATAGCQGSSITLGELWVVYSIDLFNPVIPLYATPFSTLKPIQIYVQSTTTFTYPANVFDIAVGKTFFTADEDGHIVSRAGSTIVLENMPVGSFWNVVLSTVRTAGSPIAATLGLDCSPCNNQIALVPTEVGPEVTAGTLNHIILGHIEVLPASVGTVTVELQGTALAYKELVITFLPAASNMGLL